MSEEERTAKATREASARLSPSYTSTTSAATSPATKGKGTCNQFNTDEGCYLGECAPTGSPRTHTTDAMCGSTQNFA
eukprot:12923392-Prorocentrum_lima.AAC.1